MIECPACQPQLPPADQFCRQCGVRVATRCRCGDVFRKGDRFCGNCGVPRSERASNQLAASSVMPASREDAPSPPSEQAVRSDLQAAAEADRKHYQLGHSKLQQSDINDLFQMIRTPDE
jgi:hypothetical protein